MAAVIRLKRRVDEDPLDAFVLNCKRQRTELPDPNRNAADPEPTGETSTVLKFAGTFTKSDNISSHLRLSKDEAKEAISRVHRPKNAVRNREASRQKAQNSRFRIVNCTRSLGEVDGVEGATIVDVERDIVAAAAVAGPSKNAAEESSSTNGVEQKRPEDVPAAEQDYVYDLYVADEAQQQLHIPYIPDNLDDISVAIYDDPLYSSHRGLGDRSDDSAGEESEDSNDENNWRNDYPDEDEDVFGDCQSVDEDDMRRAVEELDLEGDRELSSDEEEDYGERADGNSGFAYPVNDDVHDNLDDDDGDDDEYRDADDDGVNVNDVNRFGTAYARYKARIMKQFEKKQRGSDSEEYESEIDGSDDCRSSSSTRGSDSDDFDLYD
ncbi:probable RNA polymerase II nuclear localization protein SLC7A6OS [Aedes albopictus]|uniref:Probable RNA polymerase II nuclear localization protein SLC7A6OS n=1 Tax=Aedes albopictus TaxID=7160 RepID=A0ABM1YK96_AEDAL